jgi:hypothetical protein
VVVGQPSRPHNGVVEVGGAKCIVGSGFGAQVHAEDLIVIRRLIGTHCANHYEAVDAEAGRGIDDVSGAVEIDGLLAVCSASRTSPRGEEDCLGISQRSVEVVVAGCLEIADDRVGAIGKYVIFVLRIANDADHPDALGYQPERQQSGDLTMGADDCYVHDR